MKILYLVHQFYPECYTGTEKFVYNLSSMVQKAGNQVKIITYSFYEDSFYNQRRGEILCKEFSYRGIPVLAIKHKVTPVDLDRAVGNRLMSDVAAEIVADERADLVHVAHTMRVGALAQVLKPLGVPFVLTLTDFFLACPKVHLIASSQPLCHGPQGGAACASFCPELTTNYINQRLRNCKSLLFNADLVVAPSNFVAGVFRKEFSGLNVAVINHGVNFRWLKRNQKQYSTRGQVVFCYAGSFNPYKGTHVLIEAFRAIDVSNAVLKIYGSGTDRLYVERLKMMAGGCANIEFCGLYGEDRTGEILSNVDVVVIPSLCNESYSMSMHEALASNVPVIAANLGGLSEKITDGINGYLFEMGDVEGLRKLIQHISEDPSSLAELKSNLDRVVVSSVEQEAYTYLRAYHRLPCHAGSPTHAPSS